MLYKEALTKQALSLLKKLLMDEALTNFSLAGGTALALQLKHRVSIDLDFFTSEIFNENRLKDYLMAEYQMQVVNISDNTINGSIENIKTDFLAHRYPKIDEVKTIEGIRLWSEKDIAAMKLNAICNRGSKKDFYDLYVLLKSYSLQEMLGYYTRKYGQNDAMMVIKSLVYFEDADTEPDPVLINSNITWVEVKACMMDETKKIIS